MVSQMTFDQAVDTYRSYLATRDRRHDAEKLLLNFLDWSKPCRTIEGRTQEAMFKEQSG